MFSGRYTAAAANHAADHLQLHVLSDEDDEDDEDSSDDA
jgi:hypothetical protein